MLSFSQGEKLLCSLYLYISAAKIIQNFHILQGETMDDASQDFAADPCSSAKRGAMVRAARALLSAVTRLLILADMVDVHLLLKSLHSVSYFICWAIQKNKFTVNYCQLGFKF